MSDNTWPPRAAGDPWSGGGMPPTPGPGQQPWSGQPQPGPGYQHVGNVPPGPPPNGPGYPHTQPQQGPGYQQSPGYQQGPPPYGPGNQPPKAPKKKRVGLIALVIVILVGLVGGGVYALARFLGPSVDVAAADALPGNVVGYFQVDLNPSNDQKMKLLSVIDKLPVDANAVKDDPVGAILRPLLQRGDVDYDADIKPWIGDTAAVASVGAQANMVVAVATKDKSKAEEFAKQRTSRGSDNLGYFFAGDTLVLAEAKSLNEVKSEVESGRTLAKNDKFAKHMGSLTDTGVASFWFDLKAIQNVRKPPSMDLPNSDELTKDFSGYVFGALRFDDNAVELVSQMADVPAKYAPKLDGDLARVGKVPGDTNVVYALSNPAKMVDAILPILREQPGFADRLRDMGLSDEDVYTLVGKSIVVAGKFDPNEMNNMSTPSQVNVGVSITGDTDKIRDIFGKIAGRSGVPFEIAVDGDTITFGPNKSYIEGFGKGDFGSKKEFTDAVGKPGDSQVLLYVDTGQFMSMVAEKVPTDYREFVRSIRSIGLTSQSVNEGAAKGSLRITFTD